MTIFLVATKDANEALGKELTRHFPGDVRRIADNQWLVSAKSTTQAFAESINPDEGGKWGECNRRDRRQLCRQARPGYTGSGSS